MDTLDLDGEHGFGLNGNTKSRLDILRETLFVVSLGRGPFLVECWVVFMLDQSLEKVEILEPSTRAESVSDQGAQRRVALIEPATIMTETR